MRFVRNARALSQVLDRARQALADTAEEVRADLVASGTMPLDSGRLQNDATTVCTRRLRQNRVAIVSDTVYARRKYFNPQFNFRRDVNNQAGGRWFDVYLNGGKRLMVRDVFVRRMKGD